ncbi:exopolyphosphatase [Alteromonas sp. ASW11-36]|uniref:Exopolyphosphatase n=1 Tax=Alteromonas arenosi TaxID=3055817 RepID=A0ABT7T097_9ALTE|nr:exopolyphosphatase [Alteromonas sp. ASW11-36]MDM7861862.1 exopolyphosphatase [Alteromonas sp. ASW11-36]
MTPDENVLDEVEVREAERVAALDLGSNSFHLVVARIVAGSVQIVHRVKQKVRLADGLVDGKLTAEAIQRGVDTLKVIAESLKGFETHSVRIVATHTLRKARNAHVFLYQARQVIPYPIEIISGTEEARLIYSGVAHTSHSEGRRLVVDIGGGSTEFVIGEGFEPKLLRSLQMGCVSYTRRFFANGELTEYNFSKAITAAQQALEMIDNRYRSLGWQACVGTSGTIKSIIALCQESPDKESPVTLKQLKQLRRDCLAAKTIDALNFEGLSEDRRPVFAGGLAILIAIFKSLHIDSMEFSQAALREGVLYQMSESLEHNDIRTRTIQSLAVRYDVDTQQANLVHATALALFDACASEWQITDLALRSMLAWAALIHEVGLQINSRGVQRHGAYIMQNVDMPGFNQEEQLLLATLVRFQRKKIRVDDIPEFGLFSARQVQQLIVLMRLAVLLNIKRQEGFLPDVDFGCQGDALSVQFPPNWLDDKPIFSADLEQETQHLKTLDFDLHYA